MTQLRRIPAMLAVLSGLLCIATLSAASLSGQSVAQRAQLTPREVLMHIQGFRVVALGDTMSLNVCPVDRFWQPDGRLVEGLHTIPAILVTQRDACTSLGPAEDWATLTELRSFGADSVVVIGKTRRGRIDRLEWYAFLPGLIDPSVWRLEYRITMYRDVHPAIDTSSRTRR